MILQQSDPLKNLRQLLSAYRKEQKLSVRSLSKLVGIEHTALWRFEQGSGLREKQWTTLIAWIFKN